MYDISCSLSKEAMLALCICNRNAFTRFSLPAASLTWSVGSPAHTDMMEASERKSNARIVGWPAPSLPRFLAWRDTWTVVAWNTWLHPRNRRSWLG
jgi:hypothetical protein